MRGDAGVGAPVVVILRELRRDDIAEHVRRARSEHLREGRDRPRHLRAERREGRHGDQGIFHPQSALLGNPGFVNGAVSGLGRGRGRCAGAWVGSRARFDPRASPDIRRSARRCRRLGSQRGAACSPRPISDLLIQQTSEFILARSERGLGRSYPSADASTPTLLPARRSQMSCQTARVPSGSIKPGSTARRAGARGRGRVVTGSAPTERDVATVSMSADGWRNRVVAIGAALALASAPVAFADDAGETATEQPSSSIEAPADLEPVEIAYDDVEVGQAPDIQAQIEKDAAQKSAGLTDLEQKAVDNNLKIKQYNNAPADFPTFVREGYDVKVITPPGYVTQEDGLVYKDFKLGEGTTPEDGQEVTFEYVAYNENGGTIDSTFRKGVPASTRLGINGMIPGFEEAIKGMKAGGYRRVVVPPELGPPIGPATFFSAKQWEVFDIELLKVKSCERQQTGFMTSTVVCTD